MAEFRDTAPLILTRKFYFTITLPQKIKKKQAPSLNCIMNTAATSKQLAVMKLTILTVMSPRIELDHSLSPRTSSRARECNNLWSFIYLFIIFLNESEASAKVIKKNNGLDRSKLYLPIYSSETIIYSPFTRG